MKLNMLALSVLVSLGGGLSSVSPAVLAATPALPDCFSSNYDAKMGLFTVKNLAPKQVNQQCQLTVGPRGSGSSSRLAAGRYQISLSNGGGGGAGGTLQGNAPGGGGGGGGAGAMEQQATVQLTEGQYRLTLGAGGPGGTACMLSPSKFDGGPGWLGSPSNIVRLGTNELVMGAAGAENFKALTRAQNDRAANKGGAGNGRGGSGPGQTTGGSGGSETVKGVEKNATSGSSVAGVRQPTKGGTAGTDTDDKSRSGGGGGGGATKAASGGSGGGETTTTIVSATGKVSDSQPVVIASTRGNLGSGGGGGEGSSVKCEPGAAGGHGFISFRAL